MSHLARATDPVTSHIAAARSHAFAGTHRERILAALKEYGPSTAERLSNLTGLTVVQIDRRLPEMQSAKQAAPMMHSDGAAVVIKGYRVWRAV